MSTFKASFVNNDTNSKTDTTEIVMTFEADSFNEADYKVRDIISETPSFELVSIKNVENGLTFFAKQDFKKWR